MNALKNIISFLKILQILSLDVVLGTLAVGYMATRILFVEVNPIWWFILPMATWVVYTLDHIVDGYKNKLNSSIERHRFHYQYRKTIIGVTLVISLITIILSMVYLDSRIIIGGVVLTFIAGSYMGTLLVINKRKTTLLQKELIIAIIYTTGIFLAPAIWYGLLPSFPVLCIIMVIGILAWTEGIMNSWFDYNYDIEDGHLSFTVLYGKKFTLKFLVATHMFIEAVILILLFTIPINLIFWSLVILLAMNLFLGIISLFPENPFLRRYHRIIGELTFLLPVLIAFY